MNLVIFTNFFPYKKAEPFFVNEFEFTRKFCSKTTIFTLYGKQADSILGADPSVSLFKPVFPSFGSKKKILLNGLFNLAPFGFHLKELPKVIFSPKKLYLWFVSVLVTRAILSSKAYKQLIELIDNSHKTVLYFYWGDNLCWIIPYLAKKVDKDKFKIINRLHGSDLYEHIKGNYAPLRQRIFSLADHIVTISEFGKHYIEKKYPNYDSKISVSRLGVFDHGLNPDKKENGFVVVSVSNLVALKRVPLIFETLQKTKSNITWFHFGDGDVRPQLEQLIKDRRSGLTVVLKGHVSNAELISFYKNQRVDLFINASTTEGLPVTIMEALSFGIPVIAPNVGGIGELVNDRVGRLIDPAIDTNQLANLIEEIVHSDKILELRKNARIVFEEKVSAEKNYTSFYKELCQ